MPARRERSKLDVVDEQVALDLRAAPDAARGGREVLDAACVDINVASIAWGARNLIATPGIAADARRRRRAGAVAPQAAAVVLLWCEGGVGGGVCEREDEKRN